MGTREWQDGTIKRRVWKKGKEKEGKRGKEWRQGLLQKKKYIYGAGVSHLLEVLCQVFI